MREAKSGERALTGSRLKERALDLLSRREHSERELFRKLVDKGGKAADIQVLFEELRSCKYLDDLRFAENFVRFRESKSWGRERFRHELLQRGVANELVSEVLEQSECFSLESVNRKLAEIVSRQLSLGKDPQKIAASLMRKGFRPSDVRAALAGHDETLLYE